MNSNIHTLLTQIRSELTNASDQKAQASTKRFFKEPILVYGIKSKLGTAISKQFQPEVVKLPKAEFFALCEEMFKSDYCEEAWMAAAWLPVRIAEYSENDFTLFELWLGKYINNWAKCDTFCNHTIGDMIEKFPELIPQVKSWTHSSNRWMKRASAVSFIIPAKHGKHLTPAFEIADTLLTDPDDMVQKGYGWLLKEASRLHQQEVFEYVCSHKKTMPRTALRYAIELMPQELRLQAMKRD